MLNRATKLIFGMSCIGILGILSQGCGGNQISPALPMQPDTVSFTDTAGPPTGTDSGSTDSGVNQIPDVGPTADPNQLPPSQSGVVYTSHYLDKTLRMTRIDGLFPETGPKIDLNDFSHDMVLDPVGNSLYVAHDILRQVSVYSLTRPQSPSDPLTTPLPLASLSFHDTPRFLTIDALNRRLYVSTAPDTGDALLTQMHIHAYDISDPSFPILLTLDPILAPVHVTMTVDSARNLLILTDFTNHQLFVYEMAFGGLIMLPGPPIMLRDFYPQENNTGFQVRSLLSVSSENRIYAARSQGANSQLITMTYNPALPGGAVTYTQQATTSDVVPMADTFDVNIPPSDRVNLLDAFTVMHDPILGSIFMVANAWNGSASSAFVYPMRNDLTIAPGCGQFEGFGCFYDGNFGAKQTDGASCIDWTHRKIIGTSIGDNVDEDPGSIHVFSYDQNLGMSPQFEEDGTLPVSGVYPLAAVCH